MAFRFRLQKVLKFRQGVVDKEARELAAVGHKVSDISEQITNLTREINLVESDFPEDGFPLAVQSRINLVLWIQHLRIRRSGLEDSREEALRELEVQREKMTAAWQDLEVLKKLKVRQKEVWSTGLLKRENQELDEVGIQRADRRRREKLAST